jgi:hypothetical protein
VTRVFEVWFAWCQVCCATNKTSRHGPQHAAQHAHHAHPDTHLLKQLQAGLTVAVEPDDQLLPRTQHNILGQRQVADQLCVVLWRGSWRGLLVWASVSVGWLKGVGARAVGTGTDAATPQPAHRRWLC